MPMRRAILPIVGPGCVAALLVACYGAVLFHGQQFGYRDAAHFYYPLYLRVQQEWEAGRLPLWAPEENGGTPLLGNPTAAVLYPGKLLYAAVPYAWGARLYVVAHSLLAVAGMYALMRSWEVSRSGSGLAALGYAFGAPVLFQYCNVIFLVGAAWAPLGLRAADRLLRLGRRSGLVELAAVLAMQTLGGDPQSAYVTVLCAGGYAAGLAWMERGPKTAPTRRSGATAALLALGWIAVALIAVNEVRGAVARVAARLGSGVQEWLTPAVVQAALPPRDEGLLLAWAVVGLLLLGARRGGWRPGLRAKLLALAGACGLAVALTAAQLLPVLEFTRQTVRAAGEGPHDIYPFSLEPYRVAELLWPNVYGVSFGVNHCWLHAIPPVYEHKIWVPSLYLGGLTLVLALAGFGLRGRPTGRAWLAAIAVLSLLASCGQFGSPLWWARLVPSWAAAQGPHDPPDITVVRPDGFPRDGDGSLYWLMAAVLPGFHTFRYPSKLLSFTTLALAGLAGIGWDRVRAGRSQRAGVVALGLLALTLAALAAATIGADRIVQALVRRAGGQTVSAFGPLQPRGAVREIHRALIHGGIALAATLLVLRLAARRPALAGAVALAVTTADLAIANARFVLTVPQADLDWERTPAVLRRIEEAERADPAPGPYRVHRMPIWGPLTWLQTASAARVRDFVRWERDTIQPKYAIPYGLQYTLTEGTTELYDYWWFFGPFPRRVYDAETAQALHVEPGKPVVYFPRRGFDLWNTRYFVLPVYPHGWNDEDRGYAAFLPETSPVYPAPDAFEGPGGAARKQRWIEEDVQILRNEAAYPRAWVVHEAIFLRPIAGLAKADRVKPMHELLFQDDALWHDPTRHVFDPRRLAWIETADPLTLAPFLPHTPPEPSETVTVTKYEPQRVELLAQLDRPGLVILADVYYPGWTLTIDGQPAPILRANRLMRGAAVEAGTHRLVYTYRPGSFRLGVLISLGGLITAAGLGIWTRRRADR